MSFLFSLGTNTYLVIQEAPIKVTFPRGNEDESWNVLKKKED